MKPSIIFFDEIDALAPVRSVRQEQVHTSVVGTLLAEMDGLCDRYVPCSCKMNLITIVHCVENYLTTLNVLYAHAFLPQ